MKKKTTSNPKKQVNKSKKKGKKLGGVGKNQHLLEAKIEEEWIEDAK